MPLDTSSIYGISRGFNEAANTSSQLMQRLIQNKLYEAQAKREEQRANLPFGGDIPSGAAGQVVGLEMLKGLYGSDSEQYKQAIKAFNLGQESDQSRINYQNTLAGTAPQRALTPQGKLIFEESNVQQGNMPTGQPWSQERPSPAPAKELAQGYGLLRQKAQSDPQARSRALSATNIDKTIDMIDPDALTQYAGINNIERKLEESKAPFGKESGKYKNYLKAMQNTELLATQVRQFYGDSIQPAMIERLQKLTNPSTWKNNPDLAKALFMETERVLRAETATYRDALKDPNAYQAQDLNPSNESLPEGNVESTKEVNGIKYAFFGGKWHEVG